MPSQFLLACQCPNTLTSMAPRNKPIRKKMAPIHMRSLNSVSGEFNSRTKRLTPNWIWRFEMSAPIPPEKFQSWLDYAIATMDARGAYLDRIFGEDEIPSQNSIRAAAQDELNYLKQKAVMPWIGMLENWKTALSKRLDRCAENIVEGNLLTTGSWTKMRRNFLRIWPDGSNKAARQSRFCNWKKTRYQTRAMSNSHCVSSDRRSQLRPRLPSGSITPSH